MEVDRMETGKIAAAQIARIEFGNNPRRKSYLQGLFITIASHNKLKLNEYVNVFYDDKKYPFRIIEVKTVEYRYEIQAIEVGYFANQLERCESLELLELLGTNVQLVIDSDEIEEIQKQSMWT